MCWYGRIESKRIAKENIHCKKVIAYNPVEKYYYPYYFRVGDVKRYEFGKTYTSEIITSSPSLRSDGYYHTQITKGIHCLSWDVKFKPSFTLNDDSSFSAIMIAYAGSIYFSYDKLFNRYPIIVDCIIPKGATYYQNQYGEIVTDTLQIVERIKLTDKPDKF